MTNRICFKSIGRGIILGIGLWCLAMLLSIIFLLFLENSTIYSLGNLPRFFLWLTFFISGLYSGIKAPFKGGVHGFWSGIFIGIIFSIFSLNLVSLIITWEYIFFQFLAAVILGICGGIIGEKMSWKKVSCNYQKFSLGELDIDK